MGMSNEDPEKLAFVLWVVKLLLENFCSVSCYFAVQLNSSPKVF